MINQTVYENDNVKIISKVKTIVGYVLIYAFLLSVAFTCVFPFVWMLLSSLKTPIEISNSLELQFFAKNPQWANYLLVFQKVDLARGFLNTMIIEVATIPMCVFFSGLSAFAFSKMDLRHKDLHLMIQLSALMIPYACVVLPIYKAYFSLQLTNTLWPLILPSLFGGVSMMFFFIQFQRGIPSAIFEAAKIDGAGYFLQYVRIMLPMMGSAVAAQVIFMFVGTWNDFFAPSLYLTIPQVQTIQLHLVTLSSGTSDYSNLPILFAGSVLVCIPLYLVYIIFQRYFIEGMAISGVKG